MRPLAIVTLLALLPLTVGQAHAEGCQGQPDQVYRFDVRLDIPAARLHRSKSRDELNGRALHGPGTNVLGLMRSQLEGERRFEFIATPHEGGHCYWIRSVDLVLRYHALDIFVATEYRRSSCAYRAILSHEKDHVRVAREYLGRFVPRFEEALRSRNLPTPNRPQFTKKAPGKVVKLQLAKLVDPVFEELNAEMARAQAALDTPQQYARVQDRCDDW